MYIYGKQIFPNTTCLDAPVTLGMFDEFSAIVSFASRAKIIASFASEEMPMSSTVLTDAGAKCCRRLPIIALL